MQAVKVLGMALLALNSAAVMAEDCAITVDSTDRMMFDTDAIEITRSCEEFTVNLTHSGSLPVTSMGHNWVLSKAADAQPIVMEGIGAGLENDYLKPGDNRVIAYTKMIGGGESASVTFAVSALSPDEQYKFFCSFPGHIGLMVGTVTVTD